MEEEWIISELTEQLFRLPEESNLCDNIMSMFDCQLLEQIFQKKTAETFKFSLDLLVLLNDSSMVAHWYFVCFMYLECSGLGFIPWQERECLLLTEPTIFFKFDSDLYVTH